MVDNSIKHLCFDKDGILIDVHKYWFYTSQIRAKFIIDILDLEPSLEGKLLWAMGVDLESRKIRINGPVGYYPRNIVIDHTIRFLNEVNKPTSISKIFQIFTDIDTMQQKRFDYKIKLLDGVKRCFESLRGKGLILSVYTSDRRSNAELIIDKVGLRNFIDIIIGGDDVNEGKPNPEGFLKACHKLRVAPNQSVYVGDTISDMIMANKGGAAMSIGLETGLFSSADLKKETKYIYPSINEFNTEIQKYI